MSIRQLLIFVLGLVSSQFRSADAQGRLNPDDFVGTWTVSFLGNTASFNLKRDGSFSSEGSLGRLFGGPNPLNATQWRIEGDQLVFFHISQRGDDQVILAGSVEWVDNTARFKLTLRRGFWVSSNRQLQGKALEFVTTRGHHP